MGSQVIAKYDPPEISGLVFYGFPLHAPGKPAMERAEHLLEIKTPMLFLQGDRDALAKPDLMDQVINTLVAAKIHYFEGANHSFSYPKKMGISSEEIYSALAQHTRDFLDSMIYQ